MQSPLDDTSIKIQSAQPPETPPPPPPAQENDSSESVVDIDTTPDTGHVRFGIIEHLCNYRDSILGKYLHDYDLSAAHLQQLSTQELEDLRKAVAFKLSVRRIGSFWNSVFIHGIGVAEEIACAYTPLNVRGLTFLVSEDKEIEELIAEIALKYRKISYIPPEARLGMALMRKVVGVHVENSARAALITPAAPITTEPAAPITTEPAAPITTEPAAPEDTRINKYHDL